MISDENLPFTSFSINGNRPTIISDLGDNYRSDWYDGEAQSISISFSDGRYFDENVVFAIIPKNNYALECTLGNITTPSVFDYEPFNSYFENWTEAQSNDGSEIVFDFNNRVWYINEHEQGKINVDLIDTFIISERGL